MLNFLESKEHPVEDCIGQCFDGFPNVKSVKNRDAGSLILEKAPQPAAAHYCTTVRKT